VRSVYAVDLLGEAGCSEQTTPIRTSQEQASWFVQMMDGLQIERAHLAGASIGGWTACNQAVETPDRVLSASLLDPVATLAPITITAVLATIPTILPVIGTWARPRFLRWVDGRHTADPSDDPVGRVISAGMQDFRAKLPRPRTYTDGELRSLRVPVLAVIAGRSVMHKARDAVSRAENLIPCVQAELWPDATRAISGQCARQVNKRISEFIDRVDWVVRCARLTPPGSAHAAPAAHRAEDSGHHDEHDADDREPEQ
jgi:pimeloyl-ACP methyl ester carboxylesterase